MAKPTSEKLFRLIKSLNRGEVKFFKIYASKTSWGGPNKYLTLFDTIRSQENYNEQKLVKKIYPEGLTTTKFRVLKHQLFQLIIKSLRNQYEEDSLTAALRTGLDTVEVLCRKMLYNDGIELLEKLKHKAQFGGIQFLSLIQYWEFRIAYESNDINLMEKLVALWTDKKQVLLEQNILQTDAISNFAKLFVRLRKSGRIYSSDDRIAFLKEFEGVTNIEKNEGIVSTQLKLYMKGLIAYISGDNELFYKSQIDLLNHVDETHKTTKKYPFFHVTALSDTALSCFFEMDVSGARKYLSLMKTQLDELPKGIRFKNFINYYMSMLAINIEFGDFEYNVPLIDEMLSLEKEYHTKFPPDCSLLFACSYFGIEDFALAMDWIEITITTSKNQGREDLYGIQRIIQIIIVYEMGESYNFLLESLVRSTYRRILKRKWNFKFEKLFLKFVRNSAGFSTKKELIEAFKNLRFELNEISKDPTEKEILAYFNFKSWLDSKIDNISFKEAIKQSVLVQKNH